ncbi:MAG: cytochrome c [Sphingomonadaceae bacterium]|jgi:mono/diheme cytochrome c family protein|nr:cytochrome c [Sphingomonadaceae bacterium]
MRVLAAFSLCMATSALAAPDGPTVYKRCAACHLPTGVGVPGAFPPLGADFATLTKTPAGRRYIILGVIKGISGPITVAGKPYRGVMPAQVGLDDEAVANVLNHVAVNIAKAGKGFSPITAAEVAKTRASGTGLTAASVAQLHASAGGK